MSLLDDPILFFLGEINDAVAVFAIILLFTLIRMGARAGIALEDQSALVAGPMGTPIAEYLSAEPEEYAEALHSHEFNRLDELEDTTERQL